MSDLIDRQAAIDVLAAMQGRCTSKAALVQNSKVWQQICELPSAEPERPPYVAEIEAEYKKWIKVPYIRKPLAKALHEVWKKHDREDAERITDEDETD